MGVHAQKLERYLGADQVERLVNAMRGWHGPPIAVARVPGAVKIRADGELLGAMNLGRYSSLADRDMERTKQFLKDFASKRNAPRHGFTSLGDLIAEATTGGKRREFNFQKTGLTGVAGVSSSLWGVGTYPPAGANASNAPTGDSPTSATTGAFPFSNPTGGDTQHFVLGNPLAGVAGNTLLLYDRLFQVNKTMASTTAEAVTGTFSRYQNTTPGTPDYIGGNFLFPEVGGTALAATAHNHTVVQYTNQAGTTGVSAPSSAGAASAIVRRMDLAAGSWFMPLNGSDSGVMALSQIQLDASVATGVLNYVVGHPIAWMPCPVANMACILDGINSAFNLARIFDNAALAFLEIQKPAVTATVYAGSFTTVSG